MATEKRQRAIAKRKQSTLKKAAKTTEIKAKKLKEKFNDNKNEVIAKMIEFGVYEESLENVITFSLGKMANIAICTQLIRTKLHVSQKFVKITAKNESLNFRQSYAVEGNFMNFFRVASTCRA